MIRKPISKSPFTFTGYLNPQVILITIIERAQDQEGKDQIEEKRKVLGKREPAQRLYFVTLSNKSCGEIVETLFICLRGGGGGAGTSCPFLAVQDSSISDIVCRSVGPLVPWSQLTIRA